MFVSFVQSFVQRNRKRYLKISLIRLFWAEERGVVEQQDPDDFMTEQTAGNNALYSRESRGVRYIDKPYRLSIYRHVLKISISISISIRSLLKISISISISIKTFIEISISISISIRTFLKISISISISIRSF